MSDSLNQLADVLYGRAAMPADYIGGSDARIFHDAADKIAAVERELESCRREIAGKKAVIEASKAAINGQVNDCLAAEDRFVAFRAAVAAALDELRADCEQQAFLIGGINDDYAEGVKFALKSLNATIAKLGLEAQ